MSDEKEYPDDELVLLFYKDGTVQLLENNESQWTSDFDDTFREQFGDEALDPDDADDILEYLEDEGYLEPGESDEVAIDVEEDESESESEPSSGTDKDDVLEATTRDGKTYIVN